MIGLVLCGGQSTRMGTDKGLLISTKKITWAQQSFSLLAKLDLQVVISVNQSQFNSYRRIFPLAELILDSSAIAIKGPLLGLLSVHIKHPAEDLFVLACDMMEMQGVVLQYLQNYYLQHNEYEAYVFTHDNTAEPLCSIYRAGALQKILDLYEKGKLEKQSIKYGLDQLKTAYVPIKPAWTAYFSNFNSPKDLTGI